MQVVAFVVVPGMVESEAKLVASLVVVVTRWGLTVKAWFVRLSCFIYFMENIIIGDGKIESQ